MKAKCIAPECPNTVEISFWKWLGKCIYSATHGGTFSAAVVCPEHEEFFTHGEYNDGDNTTNPDLVDEQKDKPVTPENTDHIL